MTRALALALLLAACGSKGSSKPAVAKDAAVAPKDAAAPDAQPLPEDRANDTGDPWVDRKLADGTLHVTLQRGVARAPAPSVTLHLVSIDVRGVIADATYTTDATGAFDVPDLVHDGTVAYHVLGDHGGDRIESYPIVMPRHGGMRVELFASEPGSAYGLWPGIADSGAVVPPGEVWLEVGGNVDASAATLVDVSTGAALAPTASTPGQLGPVIGFTGVVTGAIYVARLQHPNGDYYSRPLMVIAGQGVGRQLMTLVVPMVQCVADLRRGPDGLTGMTKCDILQLGGAPRVLPTPLRLPLPAAATKVVPWDPSLPATLDGTALVWNDPIPPGNFRIGVDYELAVTGGRAEVTIDSPFSMSRIGVAVEATPTMAISDLTGGQYRAADYNEGDASNAVWADYTHAGDQLHFVISGITTPTPCELLQEAPWSPDGSPAPAPEIAGTTRDGQQVHLSELRGKPVVLNFFASWTPPSAQEVPSLIALNRLLAPLGVTLIVVASDVTFADVDHLIPPSSGVTVWLDPSGGGGYGVGVDPHAFGTDKLPETYLIDAAGNVRHWIVNARDWSHPEALACIQTLSEPLTGALGTPHAPVAPAPMPIARDPAAPIVSGTLRLKHGFHAPPDLPVFVSVYSPAGGAPIAVARFHVDRFPFAFVITNADAVLDTWASAGKIDITAVVDQDGDALSHTSGDLRGTTRAMIGAEGVKLTIDQRVP